MDQPLTRWTCDTCGHDVSSTTGLLAFQNQPKEPFLAYHFRIVHTSGCLADGQDLVIDNLNNYLGADGLDTLLAYLTAGPGRPGEQGIAVCDVDEFVDLIRRLHSPYYEEARTKFGDPLVAKTLNDDDRWHPYLPSNLQRIAEHRGVPLMLIEPAQEQETER